MLESLGISLEETRDRVEEIAGHGQEAPPAHIPFTLPAKQVLERSLQEALHLGHQYVGTEHLLLSLVAGATASPLSCWPAREPAMTWSRNGWWPC